MIVLHFDHKLETGQTGVVDPEGDLVGNGERFDAGLHQGQLVPYKKKQNKKLPGSYHFAGWVLPTSQTLLFVRPISCFKDRLLGTDINQVHSVKEQR